MAFARVKKFVAALLYCASLTLGGITLLAGICMQIHQLGGWNLLGRQLVVSHYLMVFSISALVGVVLGLIVRLFDKEKGRIAIYLCVLGLVINLFTPVFAEAS